MLETRLLHDQGGLIVEASLAGLLDLDPAAVRSWVEAYGAVLFRSFDVDVSSLVGFTDLFLKAVRIHGEPSRRPITEDATLLEVSPGSGPIELHSELAITPNRPDLLWFYCIAAAPAGGETLLCDGIRAWNALRPETRTLFTTKKLLYVTHILPGSLKRQWPDLTHEEAVRRLASVRREGSTVKLSDEGGELRYVTSAAMPTRWGHQLAFANSITGPYGRSRKWIGFDGMEPIPDEVMAEVRAVHEQESFEVKLQAGDVIMIDNSRFMHGRRSFTGQRSLCVRMGTANW
jgi:alpha-ketoglutarate-dependent taurine dioxygenase